MYSWMNWFIQFKSLVNVEDTTLRKLPVQLLLSKWHYSMTWIMELHIGFPSWGHMHGMQVKKALMTLTGTDRADHIETRSNIQCFLKICTQVCCFLFCVVYVLSLLLNYATYFWTFFRATSLITKQLSYYPFCRKVMLKNTDLLVLYPIKTVHNTVQVMQFAKYNYILYTC